MLRALLIIDLSDDLFFVVKRPAAVRNLTAGIVGFWHAGADVLRDGAEQRRIDTVVHEGPPERDRASCIAGRGRKRREIAGQHGRRRNITSQVSRILTDLGALKPAKEEDLVLDDWPAQRAAILIPL